MEDSISPRRIAAFGAIALAIVVGTLGLGMLLSGGGPSASPAASEPAEPQASDSMAPPPTTTPVPAQSFFVDPGESAPKESIEVPPPID